MKQFRENVLMKIAATVLFLVCMSLGAWSGIYTLAHWSDLWQPNETYEQSTAAAADLDSMADELMRYQALRWQKETSGTLSYLETQNLKDYELAFSPEETNFRFRLHEQSGVWVMDNMLGQDFASVVPLPRVRQFELSGYLGTSNRPAALDADVALAPVPPSYVAEYGLQATLTVKDGFAVAQEAYRVTSQWLSKIAIASVLLLGMAGTMFLLLMRATGHRKGTDAIALSYWERVPFDLHIVMEFFAVYLLVGLGVNATPYIPDALTAETVVNLAFFTLLLFALLLQFCASVARRLKTRSLLHSTILWHVCSAIGRGIAQWPMIWRTVFCFAGYLVGTYFSLFFFESWLTAALYQGVVLLLLCRWSLQWRSIRAEAEHLASGALDSHIETQKLYPDLRRHAEQLNAIGGGIAKVVEERLRSERFKAELITNVSHDLKTPLTSIINYVDLLKKEDIQSPKAAEYIEVLERKSQRLKKLTEDLVEASKASTGNLSVQWERLSLNQLVRQALGEYEERWPQAGLTMCASLPDEEIYVEADGRHLWRVIDNLFGNCMKYSMQGTRVYLDVRAQGQQVMLSVKNVSQTSLNMPPEQLMERFARGDDSRSTEGSGLGLSIARSLTDLQCGTFRLEIDGDLFKAIVTLPSFAAPLEEVQTAQSPTRAGATSAQPEAAQAAQDGQFKQGGH